MTFWVVLWKAVLIAAVSVFLLMAVIVTIGGALDVRRLFARLREGNDDSS